VHSLAGEATHHHRPQILEEQDQVLVDAASTILKQGCAVLSGHNGDDVQQHQWGKEEVLAQLEAYRQVHPAN
jgi:hypothetical protein